MITLRQLPYIDILSLNDMMSFDTKVNIIEHCKLARIDIPKSWRKAQIADALADIFTKDPLWTLEVLPEEELEILKKLLSSSTEERAKFAKNFTPSFRSGVNITICLQLFQYLSYNSLVGFIDGCYV